MEGTRSGISRVIVVRREPEGAERYRVLVETFGDFSRAESPVITVQLRLGDDVFYLSGVWKGRYGRRWRIAEREVRF